MNKIFSLILAAVLAAPAYAAYYTPDQIKALQDKLAAATKDYQKVDLEARIAVFSMDNPASFDVIIAAIKPICAKYSMPEIKAREKACQIACFHFNRKFVADAYKIALEDKTIWIWRIIVNHKKQLGVSDQAAFDLLAQTVLDRIEVMDEVSSGKNYVGGLFGYDGGKTTVRDCWTAGSVIGNQRVGGICGGLRGGTTYSQGKTTYSEGRVTYTRPQKLVRAEDYSRCSDFSFAGLPPGTDELEALIRHNHAHEKELETHMHFSQQ